MPEKITLIDVILDQAKENAELFQLPYGDSLLNSWIVPQQLLYSLDPYATREIQITLLRLLNNEITPDEFHDLTRLATDDLVTAFDIHRGILLPH